MSPEIFPRIFPLTSPSVVVLAISSLSQLEYDANFGTLVRRQSNYLIDGVPLVAGIACLLHQVPTLT